MSVRIKKNQPTCNCCWRRPRPLTQGTNPYAPHLKYGVFPKKVNQDDPGNKSAKNKNHIPLQDLKPLNRERFVKDRKKDYLKEKQRLSDSPIFIVRPIDKEYIRRLSLSEMTHIDIKPATFKSRSPQPLHRLRLNKRY